MKELTTILEEFTRFRDILKIMSHTQDMKNNHEVDSGNRHVIMGGLINGPNICMF